MTLVGMLHHRANPEKVKKAYTYAVVAKADGIDFFYFTTGKVDINNHTILGKVYEGGEWIEKDFPFPDVIYNASYPITEKGEEIADYLYERIPVTSRSIGDKMYVYEKIQQGKEFSQFLIPYAELTNLDEFTSNKKIMGGLTNHRMTTVLGWIISGVVILLNTFLLFETFH
ncbi:glutathione synthase [Bacillus sp. V5-8f]|uniref:glutathione synthase n=1 Tax=Bacillus sp. V5-8f TaxID=2053044 RepID=UPI0011592A59|nr:glutathione synthase [Bacillus sp. V5-8f]